MVLGRNSQLTKAKWWMKVRWHHFWLLTQRNWRHELGHLQNNEYQFEFSIYTLVWRKNYASLVGLNTNGDWKWLGLDFLGSPCMSKHTVRLCFDFVATGTESYLETQSKLLIVPRWYVTAVWQWRSKVVQIRVHNNQRWTGPPGCLALARWADRSAGHMGLHVKCWRREWDGGGARGPLVREGEFHSDKLSAGAP